MEANDDDDDDGLCMTPHLDHHRVETISWRQKSKIDGYVRTVLLLNIDVKMGSEIYGVFFRFQLADFQNSKTQCTQHVPYRWHYVATFSISVVLEDKLIPESCWSVFPLSNICSIQVHILSFSHTWNYFGSRVIAHMPLRSEYNAVYDA